MTKHSDFLATVLDWIFQFGIDEDAIETIDSASRSITLRPTGWAGHSDQIKRPFLRETQVGRDILSGQLHGLNVKTFIHVGSKKGS